jgi:hypothetical protein
MVSRATNELTGIDGTAQKCKIIGKIERNYRQI